MLTKPVEPMGGCEGCPLQHKGLGFVPDKLAKRQEVICWGEAPGKNEVAKGEPFIGSAGFVLKEWLIKSVTPLRLIAERDGISYCNTLRCLPPEIQGRAYPKGEERLLSEAHCRRYDPQDMPATVILFGEAAQRLHFREELDREDATDRSLGRDTKGVMGRVGRVYERGGTRWIFAPHPAFILRQPMLVTHGVEALKIAVSATYVEPQTVPWQEAVQELMMQKVEVIV